MTIRKKVRIGCGVLMLIIGALLFAICAARVRQGDFAWLPTALFSMCLLFVGYGIVRGLSLKEIVLDFVQAITGSKQ